MSARVHPRDRKNIIMNVRLTEEVFKAADEAAYRRGIKLSDYVRLAIAEKVEEDAITNRSSSRSI